MNRRELLINIKNLCLAYGINGILAEQSFAAGAQPQRMINFVIKYTGGTTETNGIGYWNFSNTLKPLAAFRGNMTIPQGLDSQFTVPMNSHASPQICALSGSMSDFYLQPDGRTYSPRGNLANYSTGSGKSIDVLVGDKLQAQYKTKTPYLLISNLESVASTSAAMVKDSSWGAGGVLLPSIGKVSDLSTEILSHLSCDQLSLTEIERRIEVLNYVQKSEKEFSSLHLVDKEKFEKIYESTKRSQESYQQRKTQISSPDGQICSRLLALQKVNHKRSETNDSTYNAKTALMYELAIIALKENVTRSITFNLYLSKTHGYSHYIGSPSNKQKYLATAQQYQNSIAFFLNRLKQEGLYNGTLVFCNAGSAMTGNVHNYSNLSTYVINGGAAGIKGSAKRQLPVGSLHLDILRKFGINYANYGGRNHKYGLAKPGRFL